MCCLGSARCRLRGYSRTLLYTVFSLKNKCNCFIPFPWPGCSLFIQQTLIQKLLVARCATAAGSLAFRMTSVVKILTPHPSFTIWGHRNLLRQAQPYSVLPLNKNHLGDLVHELRGLSIQALALLSLHHVTKAPRLPRLTSCPSSSHIDPLSSCSSVPSQITCQPRTRITSNIEPAFL